MDCREIRKLISVYLDGELQPHESQAVKDHVNGCPDCRKELKAFEESWGMLAETEDIEPQPGFVGRFWTRLALEQSWHEKILREVRKSLLKRRLAPVFMTICVIVLIGGFSVHNYFQIKDTNRILAGLSEDDLAMVQNIELAENFDFIREIDFFEDLDIIENLDVLET